MSLAHRGRRSYKKLMQETVWGAYDFETGRLNGTCKAVDREAAWKVFSEHNERNPRWKIEGVIKEVK